MENPNKSSVKEEVFEVVKKIPVGKVATYGQIAKIVSNPEVDARIVG